MYRRLAIYGAPVLLLGLWCLPGPRAAADAPAEGVRVGMVKTFFHDIPAPLIEIATKPFSAVMREAAGVEGELAAIGDANEVARQMAKKELHLGVFHSFEFAWLQQKHPKLKPLMIAVNEHAKVAAYLVVRADWQPAGFAGLKGKVLSVPRRTKEHCRLYVEKCAADAGRCASKEFFGKVVSSDHVEAGLDELGLKKVDAVVVDSLGLEFYRDLKPGCFRKLKVLQHSEAFPPPVIAYYEGALDRNTLVQVRDGLLRASDLETGQEMMKLWKVRNFERIPQDHAESLAGLLRAYPAPEGVKLSRR